jgi:glyoxylase-like metal-dependent hydrolase (beta-lactamase superfamily II)
MRVHHINCGTLCPYGGRFFDGESHGYGPARLSCHCLLIEADNELVLVDTGLGTRDVRDPGRRIPGFFLGLCRPRFDPQETAVAQIRRLGFKPEDVRHIVLTHLDFDHAGGLDDFPQATVHLFEVESRSARQRRGPLARRRFRPQQWQDSGPWREYPVSGEPWFGFEAVRGLDGLPPEILMVPLPGHTAGHCGVAVQDQAGWKLLAGDAFFHHSEIDASSSSGPPLARAYQAMLEVDRTARLANQARLRALARERSREVDIFCSHDPHAMDRLARSEMFTSGT